MKKNEGFTLIELLAVIVILAIIALITIPIVIRTINNSTVESEKQSIMGYARAIEADASNFIIENPNKRYADYVISDTLEYKGNTVICSNSDGQVFQGNKLVLLNCYVTSKKKNEITDILEEGKNKNHYNYDNGIVTKISSDNNENDSSTTYEEYNVGERIQVEGDETGDYYRVITASDSNQDYVVALKENPLTVSEVDTYGTGHVNQYTDNSQGTTYDSNGYGGMAYYSSSTCGAVNDSYVSSGCTTSYNASDVKYVVDGWAQARFSQNQLKTVNDYTARLIKFDEIPTDRRQICTGSCYEAEVIKYDWMYNSNYWYWTMSQDNDYSSSVWRVYTGGSLNGHYVGDFDGAVRPVINLYKNKIK